MCECVLLKNAAKFLETKKIIIYILKYLIFMIQIYINFLFDNIKKTKNMFIP